MPAKRQPKLSAELPPEVTTAAVQDFMAGFFTMILYGEKPTAAQRRAGRAGAMKALRAGTLKAQAHLKSEMRGIKLVKKTASGK